MWPHAPTNSDAPFSRKRLVYRFILSDNEAKYSLLLSRTSPFLNVNASALSGKS